jgi:gag-polypeptide of LTR copia-type
MANETGNTTPAPTALTSKSPIQFSHQIHTSLTAENFLVWRHQILPVLRGHALVSFIDGSTPPPDRFIFYAARNPSPNPAFDNWYQQDQLILSWMLSSISPFILSQVVRCETSLALWETINQLHSSQSMAKVLDLKLQLQTSKKGGSTCSQYLVQIQSLADRLRSVDHEISDQELILFIMQGLGSEFESFVTSLTTRYEFPSMIEFSSLLLAHEARLLNNLRSSSTSSVNLTTQTDKTDSKQSDTSVYYANSPKQFSSQPNYNKGRGNSSRGRGHQRGRSRGKQSNYSQNNSTQDQIQCQICARWGHGALDCYHRFDIRYTGPADSSQGNLTANFNPHQALLVQPPPSNANNPDN